MDVLIRAIARGEKLRRSVCDVDAPYKDAKICEAHVQIAVQLRQASAGAWTAMQTPSMYACFD
eukprot:6447220-Pyramimonas_sp.AAC.1